MIKVLKGMKDRYFEDIRKYDYIIDSAKNVFSKYGFEKIITPIVEETELFERGVGEETDVVSKEMYTFPDKAGRSLTMRPEGTAGVVRAYLQAGLYKSEPVVKWFYYGPMYRYEAPQKGRYREFHQVGAEAFGIRDPFADAEIIKMGCEFLETAGIKNLTVEINSLGNSISRQRYTARLKKFIEDRLDKLCDNCKTRYKKNPLRVLDCKSEVCQEQYKNAPVLKDDLDEESRVYYEELKKYLELLEVNYVENYRLVRGLDYYSDTVFEIKSENLGAQSTVLAGGRYDKLLEILGDVQMPGIGFAAGTERIALLMDESLMKEEEKPVYVVYFPETKEYALNIIKILRENGIKANFDYGMKSFKSQMKKAGKLSSKYVIIIGEDEKNENKAVLKNFHTGEQEKLEIEKVIERVNGDV
ncbi:MAG: histidine--tRNA ligase [Fusobacteriales bacterium]|jgi:histidyl-tRNA synthetase|nr:histidine--tRNA ligase [Fusobacteriales bacterium]